MSLQCKLGFPGSDRGFIMGHRIDHHQSSLTVAENSKYIEHPKFFQISPFSLLIFEGHFYFPKIHLKLYKSCKTEIQRLFFDLTFEPSNILTISIELSSHLKPLFIVGSFRKSSLSLGSTHIVGCSPVFYFSFLKMGF